MRFQAAFATASAIGLFATADAFQPAFIASSSRGLRKVTTRSESIDSLLVLGSAADIGDGLPDDDISGDDLTDEMKDQGGSRFKKMMEVAESRNMGRPSSAGLENPFAKNPYAGIIETPPTNAMPSNPAEMTTEQQAEMFRKMMQGQMEVPKTPPPKPINPDRPVGRNRDADSIQNTSDLYFAQLKRDSTVRTMARYAGDSDTAEAVFKDDGIETLKDMMYENPYLRGQRDKERELFDTAAEEMLAYEEAIAPKQVDEGSTGISYKQKLMERRAKGSKQSSPPAAVVPSPSAVAEEPTEAAVEEPVVEAAVEEPVVEAAVEEPVAEAAVEEPTPQEPVEDTIVAPQSSGASTDGRQDLRTLQGLLLKHRGGPGFGAGGLKGEDINKFETLLTDVTNMLQEEALSNQATRPPISSPPTEVSTAEESVPEPPVVPAKQPVVPAKEPAVVAQQPAAVAQQPAFVAQQPAVASSAVSSDRNAQIESMCACLEGAVTMYRNSPAELKESVLVTLRAALLSAVTTCDKIITQNEAANFEQYQAATASMDLPPPSPPAKDFYEVLEAPKTEAPKTEAPKIEAPKTEEVKPMGGGSNTEVLNNIYEKIKAASGDGKLGLRSDLTTDEASDLASSISEMRGILLEELNSAIPQSPAADSEPSTTGQGSYEKMLAKARAKKEDYKLF